MKKTPKAIITVQATCTCGNRFQREIKRGRPQVWCPECLVVPFAKRGHSTPPAVVDGVGVDAPTERIHNENDTYDSIRSIINDNMDIWRAGWPDVQKTMRANGASWLDISLAEQQACAAVYKSSGVR